MPWVKGQSGNLLGRGIERPFYNALNDEIAAAGNDNAELREIARNLLRMAKLQDGVTALPAIMALADRLEGKPAQESLVRVVKREASDWSRDELVAFLHDAASLQQRELETRELKTIEAQAIKELKEPTSE